MTARCCALQVLEQDRAPALFNLVFAEGIINDATTVAVLRTVQARFLQETAFSTLPALLIHKEVFEQRTTDRQ